MGINQAQHVLHPHDVIPGHGSSLKVEGELDGRRQGEGGGCVFSYVYNPSYPSTDITVVPIQLFSLYTRPSLAPVDSARQPSGAGIYIFIMEWFEIGVQLINVKIWTEIVH